MITSFGDKATENLYHGLTSKETRKYPNDLIKIAVRKLDMLNGTQDLKDIRSPPGNQLEALKGNLKGFFSIRVNSQWRIIFKWESKQAKEVKLTDYH
ncbi:MAG: type II toxin-antitoxin system RelE/ParE family toxin [Actinomycetota bacterium]|nr:type II toxin-antitoxin system RelE/ParE family toxin [Actinomycetota bacterium]